MYSNPFSTNVLKSVVRAGDAGRYQIDLDTNFDEVVGNARETILSSTLDLQHQKIDIKNGRTLHLLEDYNAVLALRATARAIALAYKIRPRGRDNIVRGVLESLFDSTPSSVLRCDFSSFYENIEVGSIVDEILTNTKTHPHVREVLRKLQEAAILDSKTAGIPRGLGLSATLAELRMKQFDDAVRRLPNVYRYYRFADDFVIFSLKDTGSIVDDIKKIAGQDLKINLGKTIQHELFSNPDTEKKPCPTQPVEMDFLGYKFVVSTGIKTRKSRDIRVTLSNSKIGKRKSRIILALKDFKANKNQDLLMNRIQLLTSNMSIRRSGHSLGPRATRVKTGIFYNYRACGTYRYSGSRPVKLPDRGIPELKALDGFLFSLLWRPNSQFNAEILRHLSEENKGRLRKLSFHRGFEKRMTVRFTRVAAADARRIWRHA
ncbi:antiviral reverse transcriptase Drt3a [Pseudovibrio ascidiaceicola]|uniref:antiviral reverse transcriptase Drt3a n=1 Tax=Pseudovibrio ascidiaceicola TaxID=285279 RepID=UPI003D359C8C